MGAYLGANKISAMLGTKVGGGYFQGKKVLSSLIPDGAILWKETGKYGSQTVTLSQPISKLRNGIKVSFGSKVNMTATYDGDTMIEVNGKFVMSSSSDAQYTYTGTFFDFTPTSPITITTSQLNSGKVINLSKSGLMGTNVQGKVIPTNGSNGQWETDDPGVLQMTVQKVSDTQLKFVLVVAPMLETLGTDLLQGTACASLDSIVAY